MKSNDKYDYKFCDKKGETMKNKYLLAYEWINWSIVFFLIILLVIMNLISVTIALSFYILIMFLSIIQVFLDDKIKPKNKRIYWNLIVVVVLIILIFIS